MTQASANSGSSTNVPDKGEETKADVKDVPELEEFNEDEFEAAFARLEEPKKS